MFQLPNLKVPPDDSLSDSAPESDDLGSLESEGESDRENHGSDRLPPGKFTADTVACARTLNLLAIKGRSLIGMGAYAYTPGEMPIIR